MTWSIVRMRLMPSLLGLDDRRRETLVHAEQNDGYKVLLKPALTYPYLCYLSFTL